MTRISFSDLCHPCYLSRILRSWGCGALWRDPELDVELISRCTYECYDPSFIESSRVDKIFNNAARMMLHVATFTRLSRVHNHVRRRCRIVLQFDREVV